ncbi:MAG: L-threonylcarbamoyladenylate synthase, partial [Pseudomonadota bacterium]
MEILLPDDVDKAAEYLLSARLVAFPTETVYGLGARADNDLAVAGIFEAKGRPSFNPLIVHVASMAAAEEVAILKGPLRDFAEAFWPGPLTIVAPSLGSVSKLVTAGLSTVAVRVPNHPLALKLLAETGCPIAAPSANPSGQISPTEAQHVVSGLGSKIAAVLDGGTTTVGVESTIVGLVDGVVTILRPGGITQDQIEIVTGQSVKPLGKSTDPKPSAPGQLASHYAPAKAVRLNAASPEAGEVFLGFGDIQSGQFNLSPTGNLKEAAANLFRLLHELDALETHQSIAVAPIPNTGLGVAINDRLSRAAAPR